MRRSEDVIEWNTRAHEEETNRLRSAKCVNGWNERWEQTKANATHITLCNGETKQRPIKEAKNQGDKKARGVNDWTTQTQLRRFCAIQIHVMKWQWTAQRNEWNVQSQSQIFAHSVSNATPHTTRTSRKRMNRNEKKKDESRRSETARKEETECCCCLA